MTIKQIVKFLAVGQIRDEFIINLDGRYINNRFGGSLIYTAAAISHWGGLVGLVGSIGNSSPTAYLKDLEKTGMDIRGIRMLPYKTDMRAFYAYLSKDKVVQENPVAFFSSRGLPFPKDLLGYTFNDEEQKRFVPNDISKSLPTELPADYMDALAAHICPLDITCQIHYSTIMLKGSIQTITIQPHPACMIPANWELFPVLVKDTTAIITTETELRSLFNGRSTDIWEMMESTAAFGSHFIIVDHNSKGFYFFDSTDSKKYHVPRYAARVIDPTGEIDALCGGFLSGFQSTYDPLQAIIQGIATASISTEKSGPFSINESLPGLEKARMEVIRSMTTRI